MISQMVDFFPFNIATGPAFLGFYAVLGVATFVIVAILRALAGRSFDQSAAASRPNAGLRVGRIPRVATGYADGIARAPEGNASGAVRVLHGF